MWLPQTAVHIRRFESNAIVFGVKMSENKPPKDVCEIWNWGGIMCVLCDFCSWTSVKFLSAALHCSLGFRQCVLFVELRECM